MKNLTINLISITFLILVFLSSRIIFKDIEYSYIEVTMPIRCGITDNNNLDINSFHIDTIRLGDKSFSKSNRKLNDIIYEATHSNELASGLVINLKNATYNEFINLLDSFIRNKIGKFKYEDDFAYYFPQKLPDQIYEMQTWYINPPNTAKPIITN